MRATSFRSAVPVVISGTGHYVPEQVITNAQLIERFGLDTTDEWIRTRVGLSERRWAREGEFTSDLAIEAGRRALDAAGVAAEDLGHIIVATTTGDWISPATACVVQHKLGARCGAHDVGAACSGFIYAFDHAARMVATGQAPVLVVAANVLSRFLNPADRRTMVIFGDAAGAAVVTAGDESYRGRGLIDVQLWAEGGGAEELCIPAGGSRLPASAATVAAGLHAMTMRNGPLIFQSAALAMAELIRTLLARNGLGPGQIDWLVPHQANKLIVEKVGEQLAIPPERVVLNFERYGNSSAATVATALDELARSGRPRPGDVVLLVAVGAGFNGAAMLYRW